MSKELREIVLEKIQNLYYRKHRDRTFALTWLPIRPKGSSMICDVAEIRYSMAWQFYSVIIAKSSKQRLVATNGIGSTVIAHSR